MNKLLGVLTALAVITGGGLAAAQNVDPTLADRAGVYVGGTLGTTTDDASRITAGAVVGYQAHRNLRLEGTYDNVWNTSRNGSVLMLNVVPQYRVPNSTLTVYGVAGAGLGWDNYGRVGSGDAAAVYNVGAGVRIAVSHSVELDARARYVAPVTSENGAQDAVLLTLGAAYRF
jgi:opacity protein-like surface antigen